MQLMYGSPGMRARSKTSRAIRFIMERLPAYDWSVDVKKVTAFTVTGLTDGRTYYFAVTAYDTSNLESTYSNEVSTNTCRYSISPPNQSFPASGGSGSISVGTQPSTCSWSASSSVSWLTITSGSSGTGNGTVRYSVNSNNNSSSRTASSTIAKNTFTVTQEGSTTTTHHHSLRRDWRHHLTLRHGNRQQECKPILYDHTQHRLQCRPRHRRRIIGGSHKHLYLQQCNGQSRHISKLQGECD